MKEKRNGVNEVMTGLVVGTVAGGIAALMLSPMSGRRLRRSLARGGRRFRRRASNTLAFVHDRSEAAFDHASESLHGLAVDSRRVARSLKNR
jgi:gas vesicle protein